MTPDDAWLATQGQLELQLHRSTYDTWVRDCEFITYDGGVYTIGVRNAYVKDWLEQRLYRAIKHTLSSILHEPLEVEFVIQDKKQTVNQNGFRALPLPFPETIDDFEESDTENVESADAEPTYFNDYDDDDFETHLNGGYKFENFITGISNRMAFAAAETIAESARQSYNPLFIHSDVGLGKTHLLHAIGNACRQNGRSRVLYTTAEQFTNRLVETIREKNTVAFREQYRTVDVLLVDDIQFLSGKGSSQEEFFHTFNTLHSQGKQIVLAADCPPGEIRNIEKRLQSRFTSGLLVELKAPDTETRVAIVQDKAETQGHQLSPLVATRIAESAQGNVRELTGLVTQVLGYVTLMNTTITLETVEHILQETGRQRDFTAVQRRISLKQVIQAIADYEQLPLRDLAGKGRTKDLVRARQFVIYLAREETQSSLPEIGEALGGRNHSTIIYNYNKIVKEIEQNPELRGEIEEIRKRIYHSA